MAKPTTIWTANPSGQSDTTYETAGTYNSFTDIYDGVEAYSPIDTKEDTDWTYGSKVTTDWTPNTGYSPTTTYDSATTTYDSATTRYDSIDPAESPISNKPTTDWSNT